MPSRLVFLWISVPVLFVLARQEPTVRRYTETSPPDQASPAEQSASQGMQKKPAGIGAFPTRPPAPPAEVAHGKQLFEANCSFCHGTDAMGGEAGPNLLLSTPVMHDRNGETITPIVHNGFPARGMPGFTTLRDADIRSIAAFLHSVSLTNRGAPSKLDILVGNAQAGEMYFHQHCAACHTVSGTGAGSLAGIGSKYSAKMIQDMVVSGRAGVHGFGGEGAAPSPVSPTTVKVLVTLPSGQTVGGILDDLSPFVVSLTETDGTYRSLPRHGGDPKIAVHDPLTWHVNMLPKWNDTDIHNLTAYLVTLK